MLTSSTLHSRFGTESSTQSVVHPKPMSTAHSDNVLIRSSWRRVAKRAMDVTIATIALFFFLPIIALACLAIAINSRGPVIFRQERGGLNGKPFRIFKLRTMRIEPVAEESDEVQQAQRNDPRVTRVGAFLRKTSIDELPQLFNVLAGDMSIVGPRPHAVAHDNHFASLCDDYYTRLAVKPGITGLAQINGLRGECKTIACIVDRVAADREYIANATIRMDVSIILRTVPRMFADSRAY